MRQLSTGRLLSTALVTLLSAEMANADFQLRSVVEQLAGGQQAISIRATNDGASGTGVKVVGYDLSFVLHRPLSSEDSESPRVFFNVTDTDDNRVSDTVDAPNKAGAADRSFLRVGAASTSHAVTMTPSNQYAEPNPFHAGVSEFRATLVSTTNNAVNPIPNPDVLIALLLTPSGTGVDIGGRMFGDFGPTRSVSLSLLPSVATPEPTTMLLAGGVGVVGLARRRR